MKFSEQNGESDDELKNAAEQQDNTGNRYLKLIPAFFRYTPQKYLWSSYDAEADVLYINFKKPSHATDSELTDSE